MLMKVGPLRQAIASARSTTPGPVIYLGPSGRRFDQSVARRLAGLDGFVLVSGRYEGIDERVIEADVDEELSLGDFVLSGGEIAAMAVIDAVVRLMPGALGDAESAEQDSFMIGRKRSTDKRFRTCCCPGTMQKLRAGACSSPLAGRGNEGRICWRHWI